MTHNEKRAEWWREGLIGLGVGVLYGTTSVCVGHPFDTIKTKMQAQPGFEKPNMIQSFVKTVKTQGLRGLYRGSLPPLFGSGIYRSAQFAVYEGIYTYLGSNQAWSTYEFPLTGGLQVRVLIAGSLASTVRALIETPLEYAKVRGQTGQKWRFMDLYKGFGVTWIRTIGLMTTYFILIDWGRRNAKGTFETPILGPFFASGLAATAGWWLIWPFETMKSQVQCGYGKNVSLLQRIRLTMRERGGFFALYRGIGPGTIRSFLANGTSMIVMQFAQKKVTDWGIRKM
ncbi:hypothetical protein LOD99_2281 [Oopsacas minuta]|uniref:Mitochondrial carrier protein n=1 Tax=Oopsacas minuta TaxID=111878 RepID=A0AAV7K1A8_9METZ|nr:hypothetical protein LOD99_2281 [Oopsacas minuta]